MPFNNISVINRFDFEGKDDEEDGGGTTVGLQVEFLDLDSCNITTLEASPFDNLTTLHTLGLSNNLITDEGIRRALKAHPRLESLVLSGNLLETVPNLPTKDFPYLRKLFISHSRIRSLSRENLKGMTKLEILHLHFNPLQGFPDDDDTFAECPNIEWLHFDHTEITQLPNITYTPRLTTLHVNHAKLTHLPDDICCSCSALGILELKDNLITEVKPLSCHSLSDLDLGHNQLTSVPPDLVQSMELLHIIDLRENQISEIANDFFLSNTLTEFIEIGGNRLTSLPDLSHMQHIIRFNASHNRLSTIPKDTFKEQVVMDKLYLNDNEINYIDPKAFPVPNDIKILSLSRNLPLSQWVLPNHGFPYLSELYLEGNPNLLQVPHTFEIPLVVELYFTYPYHCCIWEDYVRVYRENVTEEIDEDFLIVTVPTVDPTKHPDIISGCKLTPEEIEFIESIINPLGLAFYVDPITCKIMLIMNSTAVGENPDAVIEEMEKISAIISSRTGFQITPTYRREVQCSPPRNPLTPCQYLLDPWILKVAIWAVWVLALLGNGAVLFIGIASHDKLESNEILICALAIADILMGVYLAFLAIVDIRTFGSTFYQSALGWQLGAGCKSAGFIAVFSSELSIYLLVMLTLERVYTISHSFNQNEKKRRKVTLGLCILGCVLAAVLALLPIVGVNSYNEVAVCLPYLTERFLDRFYIGFILSINFVGFLVILASYIYIFWVACRNAPSGNMAQRRRDMLVASSKIAVVIITAFICWAPIAVIGYPALFGIHLVDASEAKYFIVFVYPVNACINPFIYAIFTKRFRNKFCTVMRRSKDRVTSFPPNSHLRIQRTPSAFTSEYQMSRMGSPGGRHEELMKLRQSRRSSSLVVQMVDTSLNTPSPTAFKPPSGCNLGRRASLPPGFGSTLNMAGSGLGGGHGGGGSNFPHYPFRLASSLYSSDNSSLPNLQEESDTELDADAIFGGEISGEQRSNPLTNSLDSNLRRLSVVEEESEGDILGGVGNSCAAIAGLGLVVGGMAGDRDDCFSDSSSEEYSDASDSIEHLNDNCVEAGTDLDHLIFNEGHVTPDYGSNHDGGNQQTINLDQQRVMIGNLSSTADVVVKDQPGVERRKGIPCILRERSPLATSGNYLSALELANNERKISLDSSLGSEETNSLRHSKAYSSKDIYTMMSTQPIISRPAISNQANRASSLNANTQSVRTEATLEDESCNFEDSGCRRSKVGSSSTNTHASSPHCGVNSECDLRLAAHQSVSATHPLKSSSNQEHSLTSTPSPSHHNSYTTTSATSPALSSLSVTPSNTPPTATPSLNCEESHVIYRQARRESNQDSIQSDSIETDV